MHEAEHAKVLCSRVAPTRVSIKVLLHRHKVFERLGHFEALDMQVSGVKPVPYPWLLLATTAINPGYLATYRRQISIAPVRLALSYFIGMVRKLEIDPTRVHIQV